MASASPPFNFDLTEDQVQMILQSLPASEAQCFSRYEWNAVQGLVATLLGPDATVQPDR